jgi:leucyl aminopeptidase
MTLTEACRTILGKETADAIIADQGELWAAVAAIAAAKTSHPLPALERLREHLRQCRAGESRR